MKSIKLSNSIFKLMYSKSERLAIHTSNRQLSNHVIGTLMRNIHPNNPAELIANINTQLELSIIELI